MKVRNETDYRTADLRKIFLKGLKEEGMNPKVYHITVVGPRRRDNRIHGLGWYRQHRVKIFLPPIEKWTEGWVSLEKKLPAKERMERYLINLAQVFIHEIGHNQNLRHKEMVHWSNIDVPWVWNMALRYKETKVEPKADVKVVRFEKARQMLAKHESKLRRQQKLVKKWKAKVKYYERTFERAASKKG